jgi:hypothetical protein
MANIYVRSTDGSDADNGSTWALAKATLTGAAAIDAAGDTIYVSQAHAESTAASVTIALAGTTANPVKIICGNDAAEPPTATATTATITTTTSSGNNINFTGSGYVYGLTLSSAGTINLISGTPSNSKISFEGGVLNVGTSASTGSALIIGNTAVENTEVDVKSTTIKFNNTAQSIRVFQGSVVFDSVTIDSAGSAITRLVTGQATSRGDKWEFRNSNLAAMATSANITSGGNGTHLGGTLINCKLPTSWSGTLVTGSLVIGERYGMYNCDSGDTNYRLLIEDYAGAITSETTLVRTGGATDGTTPISWKMVSNANTNEFVAPLVSDPISVWQETVGSSITATVEILRDSATNLTDAEVWIEVEYLGTSGFPLGVVASDHRATILTTAADQTTSAASWTTTGMANPNEQKLSVTFTPQEKGLLTARVYLAKASTTIYVDPEITVT